MMKGKKPSKVLEWLLGIVSDPEERDSVQGDFEEIYEEIALHRGKGHALRWYGSQILKSVPLCFVQSIYWGFVMFKNYLKTALRHFRKQKAYSLINILGLAMGMACCMLIMLWVQDELAFEKFNAQLDNIYCVAKWSNDRDNVEFNRAIPAPLMPHLKEKWQEIDAVCRYRPSGRRLFTIKDHEVFEDEGAFADPGLFDVFTFPAAVNDPKAALRDMNTIVLTRSMARRYFGSEDPIGETIMLENEFPFIVGAIIEDTPRHSTLRFDYLVAFENYGRFESVNMESWGRYENYSGYLTLNPQVSPEVFSGKIEKTIEEIMPDSVFRLKLFPYKILRLYGLNGQGAIRHIIIFSSIALLILLIACINFINLTTAQSGKRAREIGLRKVIGAHRSLVRKQVYTELTVMVIVAFLGALGLVMIFLPQINAVSGKEMTFSAFSNMGIWLTMLGIAFLTALVSGSYPAYVMSRCSPLKVLKSSAMQGAGHSSLRKVLVVIQFSISIILIISSLFITKQMNFIKTSELGFDKDHLVYTELMGNLSSRFETVKAELLKNPNINNVAVSIGLPHEVSSSAGGIDWEGRPADVRGSMHFVSVDRDYFKTVGIEFLEGETFKTEPNDRVLAEFIVNEAAIDRMHIENPVGKRFEMWGRDPGRIIGIVKNVHNTSLHESIRPAFYVQFPYFYQFMILNIQDGQIPQTLGFIKDVFKKINPAYPVELHFLNENVETFYQTESQIHQLIAYFTVIAVLISCLGLFGLSLFMAQQRVKEIGIRKTLGASVSGIVGLMSRDFMMLVAVSNLIAWPVAFFIMKGWLENFAYRTPLDAGTFLFAGMAALVIALATISVQALHAARANPVDSLRYE